MRVRVAVVAAALALLAVAVLVAPARANPRSYALAARRAGVASTATAQAPGHLATGVRGAAALRDALTRALRERAAGTRFAVAVVDHRTGMEYTFQGSRRFETASVVKVDILATLLLRRGGALSAGERSLATLMIRNSDNDAASALWDDIGGASGLAGANRRFGLTGTTPDPEGYWGLTTTTVTDQVRLLDAIADPSGPLDAGSRGLILGLMGQVSSSQDWGVSAAAKPSDNVALKNGWLAYGGGWIANSVGRITGPETDLTIAVLSKGHPSYAAGVGFVESVARLTRKTLDL